MQHHQRMKTTILLLIYLVFAFPCFSQEPKVLQWKSLVNQNKKDTATLLALDSLTVWYGYKVTDTGTYYLQELKKLSAVLHNKRFLMRALRLGAEGDFIMGKTTEALKQQYEALALAEELKDTAVISNNYSIIGNSHKEYGDYVKALFFYKKAYNLALLCHSEAAIHVAFLNMGYVYAQLNHLDSALSVEQQAYSLAMKGNRQNIPGIESYLGDIHYKLGNIEIAKAYYYSAINKMLSTRMAIFGTRAFSWCYLGLSNCYQTLNKTDSSFSFAKKALEMSQKIYYLKGVMDAQKRLSELFEKKQQVDSAFYYQKLYIITSDSLYNRDKSSAVASLTFEQDMQEQERQVKLEKIEEERQHNIQLVITAIAILTFLILFLLLSRSILVSHKVVGFLNVVVLLVVFEFINLFIHPFLEKITHHSPVLMLLALVSIAALIVPFHHRLEHWTTQKLVEKNKAIRLAKAKKTVEELENKERNT